MKASQVRMKRAALHEALMSRQPAMQPVWFATTPTGIPPMRTKPIIMLRAYIGEISKKKLSSAIFVMMLFMS